MWFISIKNFEILFDIFNQLLKTSSKEIIRNSEEICKQMFILVSTFYRHKKE